MFLGFQWARNRQQAYEGVRASTQQGWKASADALTAGRWLRGAVWAVCFVKFFQSMYAVSSDPPRQ